MRKVAYLGHSYVRDLQKLNRLRDDISSSETCTIQYFCRPGSCFSTWLQRPKQLLDCVEYDPDFLVVCLGGNSIIDRVSDSLLQEQCYQFYELLNTLFPSTILISVQIEIRFPVVPNKFGTPSYGIYKKRRAKFNKFLKKFKIRHYMANIQSKGRLDNRKYYKDEVHLNSRGLRKYYNLLHSTVRYAFCNLNKCMH
jgi:lysophospholipase L1-like esterase